MTIRQEKIWKVPFVKKKNTKRKLKKIIKDESPKEKNTKEVFKNKQKNIQINSFFILTFGRRETV